MDPVADGHQLFADERLRSAWGEIRGQYSQRRVRLRIDTTAPELHAISWELLRDAIDEWVVIDLTATTTTPFSRYLSHVGYSRLR